MSAQAACREAQQTQIRQPALEVIMQPTLVRELVGDLEAELNNGGFDQFFFNAAGDRTAETIAALEAIGAKHAASIVRAAAAKFPGGIPPADRATRQDLLSESVSPESDAFESEDEAFLEYRDDLEVLVSRYTG
jgi:hypothetical protein